MSVLPLTSGTVLALSPALLSFSANDGQANPSPQTLTISNPGARPLAWSLASQAPATATAQLSLLRALGPAGNWLNAAPLSGVVALAQPLRSKSSCVAKSSRPARITARLCSPRLAHSALRD